jgi:5-methylcytosine-specific restriction enzyme subunit McrC
MLIEATDLSVIRIRGDAEDAWLRQLAQRVRASALTLRLSQQEDDEDEPVLSFDARTGLWWTGRYVGELRFQDGVLRILPRFGVPQLQRWLSRIWGVRIIASQGRYESSHLWLWELLAKLWEARLLAAAKHGLPTRRIDEVHIGPTIRGRLDVRSSARELHAGNRRLVSRSRNRSIDRDIASVILCAFANLRSQLAHLGDPRTWLTPRAQNLILALQSQYGARVAGSSVEFKKTIRYTPITEAYRPLVGLSLSILRQRPMSSATEGKSDVLGVLIDMAEVWELYVYNLLRSGIVGTEVLHTGRSRETERHLLLSDKTGAGPLGRLKPDILVRSFATGQLLSVLDAKYKSTVPSSDKPSGVLREDLYQLNAYLSAFASHASPLIGGLVYPGERGASITRLQSANAWRTAGTGMPFYFFGIDSDIAPSFSTSLTSGESEFVNTIQTLIGHAP